MRLVSEGEDESKSRQPVCMTGERNVWYFFPGKAGSFGL